MAQLYTYSSNMNSVHHPENFQSAFVP